MNNLSSIGMNISNVSILLLLLIRSTSDQTPSHCSNHQQCHKYESLILVNVYILRQAITKSKAVQPSLYNTISSSKRVIVPFQFLHLIFRSFQSYSFVPDQYIPPPKKIFEKNEKKIIKNVRSYEFVYFIINAFYKGICVQFERENKTTVFFFYFQIA